MLSSKIKKSLPEYSASYFAARRKLALGLASVYLGSLISPWAVVAASPSIFFSPNQGASRLPLEVGAFNAPGFGEVEDAINLATGNVFLSVDAISHNNTDPVQRDSETKDPVAGNWNMSSRLRLDGFSNKMVVSATDDPKALNQIPYNSTFDTNGLYWESDTNFPPVSKTFYFVPPADGTNLDCLGISGFQKKPIKLIPGRYKVSFDASSTKGALALKYGIGGYTEVPNPNGGKTITPLLDQYTTTATANTTVKNFTKIFDVTTETQGGLMISETMLANPEWLISNTSLSVPDTFV
jgi:hypothetical protein